MYGYIYLILNKVNGKTYVGKKKLYRKKWNEDYYMGSGKHLKLAHKKYGIENFEKFLICYTESEEDARKKEKFWIAEYRSRGKAEYNITDGGEGGNGGANKGKTPWNKGKHLSEESKKKISEAMKCERNPLYGKQHSEETKKKISESLKGHDAWNKGKHHSNETKKKISRSMREKHNGKHWFNNGKENKFCYECPEGFAQGKFK